MNGGNEILETKYLIYRGGSMRSLFRPLERLRIEPSTLAKINPGDVIVFRRVAGDRFIVHRVTRREKDGLITRGDDRPRADDRVVGETELIGRVDAVWRKGRWRPVQRGLEGVIRARIWQTGRRLQPALIRLTGSLDTLGPAASAQASLQLLYQLLARCESGETLPDLGAISDAEWLAVFKLADTHQLASYIAYALRRNGRLSDLPADTADRFVRDYQLSWARTQRLTEALRQISETFGRNGIEFIALKGLWFAHALYPEPPSRPMTDLDLLIRPSTLTAVLEILASFGYARVREGSSVSQSREIGLYNARRHVKIDLHLELTPYYADIRWDAEEVWQRSQIMQLAGIRIRVPAPEDQLFHIVMHAGFEHLLQPLRVLLDARLAFRTWGQGIDEHEFLKRLDSAGLTRSYHLVTEAIAHVFSPVISGVDISPGNPVVSRIHGVTDKNSVPEQYMHWVLDTAPVMQHSDLLRFYAARDYLLYLRKRLRLIMARTKAIKALEPSNVVEYFKPNPAYVLRHALTLIALLAGMIAGTIRHRERKQLSFLQLLLWISGRV